MDTDEYSRWVLATPKPRAVGPPRRSYFICGTPRCGSWLLCGLLASTGVAGLPHEWFWRDTRESLMQMWAARDDAEYLELVLAAGSTSNGVFGAKVMWGHLPELAPFPRPRFIWLRRRDRLAQSVSFARAVQSGHWHRWDPRPARSTTFRFSEVETLLLELDAHNREWEAWFDREGLDPLELEYEELVANPTAETLRVLDWLAVELPAGVRIRPLTHPTRSSAGDDWCARYRAEAASRAGR